MKKELFQKNSIPNERENILFKSVGKFKKCVKKKKKYVSNKNQLISSSLSLFFSCVTPCFLFNRDVILLNNFSFFLVPSITNCFIFLPF